MYTDLKEDVLEVLDEAIEFLTLTEEDAVAYGYHLNAKQSSLCIPVPGGWRIVTLSTLTPHEQAETVAHELGHLLLQGEGLVPVRFGEDGLESALTQEINSVVSHRFLIERLAKDYQIGSEQYLRSREEILKEGAKLINELADEKIMLHALGLQLLDLAVTTQENQQKITELLELSTEVLASFEAGQEYLLYPTEHLALEEQWHRIKAYLKCLDYDTDLLWVCG